MDESFWPGPPAPTPAPAPAPARLGELPNFLEPPLTFQEPRTSSRGRASPNTSGRGWSGSLLFRGRVRGMRWSRRRPGDVPLWSVGEPWKKPGSPPPAAAVGEPQPGPAEEARARPSATTGDPTGLWRQEPGAQGPGLRGGVEPPPGDAPQEPPEGECGWTGPPKSPPGLPPPPYWCGG